MTELEKKLQAALEAADTAFEAGYPVKAHRIIKGALTLIVTLPKITDAPPPVEKAWPDGCACSHPHSAESCDKLRCHPKPPVYEDAMNH